jgi:hypothetical protein
MLVEKAGREAFPVCPGFHWRTYRRLYSRAEAHEQVFLGDTVTMITSMKKSISRFNGKG